MPTIEEITSLAFSGVASAIPGVIKDATLYKDTKDTWNTTTGQYDKTLDQQQGIVGQGVFDTERPVEDLFPDSIDGPSRKLVFLNGVGVVPKEGWKLHLDGDIFTIDAVSDVMGAGTTFYLAVY